MQSVDQSHLGTVASADYDILSDADFWERAWQAERSRTLFSLERPDRSGVAYWDHRADHFARRTASEEGKKRAAHIIHWLGHQEGLRPPHELEFLDIGCGTGNYSLLLARRAKKVVALDPSVRMLHFLRERMAAEQVSNIEPVALAWEEVDLDELGWRKRFDVVLAPMTPAIHDVPTLRKMLEACRHTIYYASFSERRDPIHQELWRRVVGKEMPAYSRDALYVFHLLYAWGYHPTIEFQERNVSREESIEEARNELRDFLWPFMEIDARVDQEIYKLVQELAHNGQVSWLRRQTFAQVSCNVEFRRG